MPFLMTFINEALEGIFGPTNSFFIETTPRKFLFEGVEFCRDPQNVANLVCDNVKDRQSPSIVQSQDGKALVFSMFAHVTFATYLQEKMWECWNCLCCRKIERTTDFTKSTLEFVGWTDFCRSRGGIADEHFTTGKQIRTARLPFVNLSTELTQRPLELSGKKAIAFISFPVIFAGKSLL